MPPTPFNQWKFLGSGFELAGVVAVFTLLGGGYDRWQGTHPWGALTGAIIGIVGGLYNLVKDAMKSNRR